MPDWIQILNISTWPPLVMLGVIGLFAFLSTFEEVLGKLGTLVLILLLGVTAFSTGSPLISGTLLGVVWCILMLTSFYVLGSTVERGDIPGYALNMLLAVGLIFILLRQFGLLSGWFDSLLALPLLVLGYIACGFAVAFWRWRAFVKKALKKNREARAEFLTNLKQRDLARFTEAQKQAIKDLPADYIALGKTAVPDFAKTDWERFSADRKVETPSSVEYATKFVGIISAWPGVLLYTLLNALLKDIWVWLYDALYDFTGRIMMAIRRGLYSDADRADFQGGKADLDFEREKWRKEKR